MKQFRKTHFPCVIQKARTILNAHKYVILDIVLPHLQKYHGEILSS